VIDPSTGLPVFDIDAGLPAVAQATGITELVVECESGFQLLKRLGFADVRRIKITVDGTTVSVAPVVGSP
jgi:hypothetical protein